MIRENETILVNKKEFVDLKAKAELYDSYLKEKSSMFNCRSGGIYKDLTGYISALKEAKKGNVSCYFCAGGSLVIIPANKFEEMVGKLEVLDIFRKGHFCTAYNPNGDYHHIGFDVYSDEEYKKVDKWLKGIAVKEEKGK